MIDVRAFLTQLSQHAHTCCTLYLYHHHHPKSPRTKDSDQEAYNSGKKARCNVLLHIYLFFESVSMQRRDYIHSVWRDKFWLVESLQHCYPFPSIRRWEDHVAIRTLGVFHHVVSETVCLRELDAVCALAHLIGAVTKPRCYTLLPKL